VVRTLVWSMASILISGCAAFGPDAAARRHLDDARATAERRELDSAYRSLVRLHREYPASAVDAEAFGLAADLFRAHYDRDRVLSPSSPWATTEALFMIEWLGTYLSAPEPPRAQAAALFLGTSYGYYREYLRYLETRERPVRWSIRVEEDNGIIGAVDVQAAEGTAVGAQSGN